MNKRNGKEIGVLGTYFKKYEDAYKLYSKKVSQRKDYAIILAPKGYLVVNTKQLK